MHKILPEGRLTAGLSETDDLLTCHWRRNKQLQWRAEERMASAAVLLGLLDVNFAVGVACLTTMGCLSRLR